MKTKVNRNKIWYSETSKRIEQLERRTGKELKELIPKQEIEGKIKCDSGKWYLSEPFIHELEEGEISDES